MLALVEARFQTGTHELYQLPLGLRAAAEGWDDRVIAEVDGWTVYDALGDAAQARELLHRIRGSSEVAAEHGDPALPLGGERARRLRRHASTCGRSASSSRTRRSCSATS